jgi:hypothetical protein
MKKCIGLPWSELVPVPQRLRISVVRLDTHTISSRSSLKHRHSERGRRTQRGGSATEDSRIQLRTQGHHEDCARICSGASGRSLGLRYTLLDVRDGQERQACSPNRSQWRIGFIALLVLSSCALAARRTKASIAATVGYGCATFRSRPAASPSPESLLSTST